MKKKGFTIVPNELLLPNQLSVQERYLYLILMKYAGKSDYCYPSHKALANDMGYSTRYITKLLALLREKGLLTWNRRGFNRPNTYQIAKSFVQERNGSTYQLGTTFPLNRGNGVPDNSTYIIGKANKGIEILRRKNDDLLKRRGL